MNDKPAVADTAFGLIDLNLHETELQVQHPIKLIDDIDPVELSVIDTRIAIAEQQGAIHNQTQASSKRQLVFSVILHSTFIAAVMYFSAQQVSDLFTHSKTVKPIQAKLYFPPVKTVTPVEVQAPQESIPVAPPEEAFPAKPEQAEAAKILKPETEPAATPLSANSELPKVAETQDPILSESNQQSSASRLERLNQALSSHMNNLNLQKLESLTESATSNRAQNFYQQQTQGYALPEPEPEMKTKKIDCSGTAGKTVGLLSGLMGGTLRCTDKPDFQKYIDARIKKDQDN